MRGFLALFAMVTMTAALIPWPQLFWLWGLTLAAAFLATPGWEKR